MTDHAYVPHPVWNRDQCEFISPDPGETNAICGMPRSAHVVVATADPLRWAAVDMSGASASAACYEVHDERGNIVALCFQQEDAEHIAALHNAALAHSPEASRAAP